MTTSDKLREIAEDKKPVHVKPGLYSLFFYDLKQIAKRYGYNLVLHGSLNRDLDLIAIPWVDKPKPEQNMIKSFQRYLSGFTTTCPDGKVHFTVLPGNRHSYIIELNRGNRRGEWMRHKDEQYYLDISVVQLSDLTALISEHYYPKEFLLWTGENCQYYPDTNEWMYFESPMTQQYFKGTDELFNYWKENEQ